MTLYLQSFPWFAKTYLSICSVKKMSDKRKEIFLQTDNNIKTNFTNKISFKGPIQKNIYKRSIRDLHQI